MSWSLYFAASAHREIRKLDPAVRSQIEKGLSELAADPAPGKLLHGRWKGIRSWRSGDYRIPYQVMPTESKIIIHRVAHRREAYE